MGKGRHRYAIALGSNQPRSRTLTPHRLVEKAMERLSRKPFAAIAQSNIIETAPLGPSRRRYANACMIVETRLDPPELLDKLHKIERKAGRKRRRVWGARTLDLDIILWSGGMWGSDGLVIPHPAFRARGFVLRPLEGVAPRWRDPVTGLRIAHLRSRLEKPRCPPGSG
ncbi:2-amino-4-hydroxy-6-hydroxymethyldihydropteridine diphosphokinase [Sphingobium sp. DEHP117]|uniref:2-amino-4-hydroxy-6- hydroxymethyldihydropteridine diphosphokinase n=1 Tax=Sphingobium sp. DEHP117 TaxID=2993436 RepID=UPI0027D662D7|nr:2-amino-4-hydroxy-6-hydroxymethyldihydropteridine diphosphokinase [Sphingobium sp. DEHP117]MDQ4420115.1 2-amino-4-hydroxy-6-hydroxymethyldihydropteridine diphosphokinase [Sphingobium sp. DEHP117]